MLSDTKADKTENGEQGGHLPSLTPMFIGPKENCAISILISCLALRGAPPCHRATESQHSDSISTNLCFEIWGQGSYGNYSCQAETLGENEKSALMQYGNEGGGGLLGRWDVIRLKCRWHRCTRGQVVLINTKPRM